MFHGFYVNLRKQFIQMKKNIYFLPLLLLSCILNVTSYAQSIYRENSVRYPGIEEVRTYHLYNKKSNPACSLKINFFYPEIYLNKEMSEMLQNYFIKSFFGQEYVGQAPKDVVKAYSKAYEEQYKEVFEKSGMYKNEVDRASKNGDEIQNFASLYIFEKTMRNTILFNSGNVISQVVNIYEYTGGAHGFSSTQGMVLDINTGKEIKYEDIFYENTEEAISALLLSALMEERKYTSLQALMDAGFDFDILHPSSNFVADDKGITFIYNPYELGAYVLGVIEIVVPYSDLDIYMKPDCTLFRWTLKPYADNLIRYETVLLKKEYIAKDIEYFPSFTTDMQFTFPSAYRSKEKLQKLQELFVSNAFGAEFASFSPSDALDVFYEKLFSEYQEIVDSNGEMIAKGMEDPANSGDMWMSLSKDYTQTNQFSFNRNDLISYTVATYRYDGGAHGMDFVTGFVVDVNTAKNLTFGDIFKSNTQKQITDLLLAKMVSYFEDYNTVEELEEAGYSIDEIKPHDNFYINERGITFIYNPYQIGAYALGGQEIVLTYAEIADYLKPNSPLIEITKKTE